MILTARYFHPQWLVQFYLRLTASRHQNLQPGVHIHTGQSSGRSELCQLGAVEVPPFKQIQGQFENLGFPDSKGKLLAAFGSRAGGVHLVLVAFSSQFPFDNNPSSALGAGYARTDNPVRHLISV
jgi:hypothetical protein